MPPELFYSGVDLSDVRLSFGGPAAAVVMAFPDMRENFVEASAAPSAAQRVHGLNLSTFGM